MKVEKTKPLKKKSASDDGTAPSKEKSIKKKNITESINKKEITDSDSAPSKAKSSKKKSADDDTAPSKAKPVKKKSKAVGGSDELSAPTKAKSAKKKLSVAQSRPEDLKSPSNNPQPAQRGVNRAASGRGPPPGRGGGGRGRAAPSQGNMQRNSSMPDRMPKPSSAPPRPQSMRLNGQVPPIPRGRQQQSARGLGNRVDPQGLNPPIRTKSPRGGARNGNRAMPPPPPRKPSTRPPSRPASMMHLNRDRGGDDAEPPPLSKKESAPPTRPSVYKAPAKPSSILRTSSIHRKPSRLGSSRRVNVDGSITTTNHSAGSVSIEEDDNEKRPMVSRIPSWGTTNSMDASGHSYSGNSLRSATERKGRLSKFASARSVLTADIEFLDEPKWKQWLRYLRILAPHLDEKPLKKKVRLLTWATLILDFLSGLVSITTYDGVTYCCGEPILNIAGSINWNVAIQVTVYVYLIMVIAEIVPVMQEAFPFNLVNPFVGFLITFAMFFDDRILEAVVMWTIEFSAVCCEIAIYWLKLIAFKQRGERLTKAELDIKQIRERRKKLKLERVKEETDDDSSSELSSGGENSFHDESDESTERPVDASTVRETRLLRERRILRQAQSIDTRHLRYHFGGVAFNASLVTISIVIIACIARSGGLCIKDFEPPNAFKTGQLEKCFDCEGTSGPCEICRDDGTSHCYYPYY
jgi:hypothetical protein